VDCLSGSGPDFERLIRVDVFCEDRDSKWASDFSQNLKCHCAAPLIAWVLAQFIKDWDGAYSHSLDRFERSEALGSIFRNERAL